MDEHSLGSVFAELYSLHSRHSSVNILTHWLEFARFGTDKLFVLSWMRSFQTKLVSKVATHGRVLFVDLVKIPFARRMGSTCSAGSRRKLRVRRATDQS